MSKAHMGIVPADSVRSSSSPLKESVFVFSLPFLDNRCRKASDCGIGVEREALSRVTTKTEVLDDIATVQNYEYDLAGRLVKVTGDTTETWGYDNNGNRTHHNGGQIATFDAQDRILTQGGVSYSHNALGQRTEKNQLGQITRYDYDVFGGLKQVVR
jgi:YD repeat-containing protein